MEMKFDIFISYKSEDANFVRTIVDILKFNGIECWFAEYEVLFHNYEDFDKYFKLGIQHSEYAILFTNDRWAKSSYCQEEGRQIFENSKIKVLEIKTPIFLNVVEYESEKIFHDLDKCPSYTFDGNYKNVILFIENNTKYELKYPDFPFNGNYITNFKIPYSNLEINVDNFSSITNKEFKNQLKIKYLASFYKETENFDIYLDIAESIKESIIPELSILERGRVNDRKIYDSYRYFLEKLIKEEEKNNIGLHLFFWLGKSHPALTLKSIEGDKIFFERRYILSIQNLDERGYNEIILNFKIYLKSSSEETKIFSLFPYIEQIVSSLKYHPEAHHHYQYKDIKKRLDWVPDLDIYNDDILTFTSELSYIINYLGSRELTAKRQLFVGSWFFLIFGIGSIFYNEIESGIITIILGLGLLLSLFKTTKTYVPNDVILAINHYKKTGDIKTLEKIIKYWKQKGAHGTIAALFRAVLWSLEYCLKRSESSYPYYLLGTSLGNLATAFSSTGKKLFSRDFAVRIYNISLLSLEKAIEYADTNKNIDFILTIHKNIYNERKRYRQIID